MKKTEIYRKNETEYNLVANAASEDSEGDFSRTEKKERKSDVTSPRRKKRQKAMRAAKDIEKAHRRQMVVGRPSWPLDRSDGPRNQFA